MSQWSEMAERWKEWGPPLRPTPDDVAAITRALALKSRVLLLGATPELHPFSSTAVDSNAGTLIAHRAWKPVQGDWGRLPFKAASFDAVIGDGSLNVYEGELDRFFSEARRVLRPGGRLVLRVFVSPEKKESLDEVLESRKLGLLGFHGWKWRVAQALADPYVPVKRIYEVVKPVWDHPTLGVYAGSSAIYYFPRISELPDCSSVHVNDSYALAERCPIVTWTF